MNNTIKISELEETTQVNDNDLLVVVDVANNETKKVQAQYVGTGQGGAEIPISDTAPLDPEEDDLWIDTSDEAGGSSIISAIFPIGSIVIKADNSDYSNWLGFTWERTLVGRVAVGIDSTDTDFDTIGETGGSKTLQAHRHAIAQKNDAGDGGYGSMTTLDIANIGWSDKYNAFNYGTSETGTGNSGNLQPYQVVAYWKRVA